MKKFKELLKASEVWIEERWRGLSARKQRKYIMLFFAGYLLVTVCVIISVWNDAKAEPPARKSGFEHIQNPILKSENNLGRQSSNATKENGTERK